MEVIKLTSPIQDRDLFDTIPEKFHDDNESNNGMWMIPNSNSQCVIV